jgi:Spy/CpxP family protein refolding chaperone
MRPGFFLRFRAELGLTDDQASRLRGLRSEYRKQAIRRHADIRIARLELGDLLAEDSWNLPRAEEKIRQISTVRTEARLARLRALARARDILTPEQREKLRELRGRRGH